jgi:transposase
LAAVSIRGFEATKIIKGPVTSKHVCEFLEHYLDHLEPDEILILDNARMHHSALVKEKIKELKRPVRYIPAYTPQLNPIENIFSEIKGQYTKLKEEKELQEQDMVKMIEGAIKNMRSKEFSKYYEHYEQWVKKGLAGELFV